MIQQNNALTRLPAQMIPYRQKVKNKKQWAKDCVDAFESYGRRQYVENMRFTENYQMLNGQFIYHHYFEQEGYKDWLSALAQELEIPSSLRHYDIIGKVINNLTEKLAEFPDVFRVQELFEEDDTNEFVRTQTKLMHDSLQATINKEIQGLLAAQGIDMNKQDFASEDEAMQYYQEVQKMAQAMEPTAIDKFMRTSWQSQGEIWGGHQLEVNKQRYKLAELERTEFRDMLTTDRCFRHYYLTSDSYMEETWNPSNTFFHVSPEVDWVQDGDYVGRVFYATKSELISRYGWKMKEKDFKVLEDLEDEEDANRDLSGYPYNTYAPFADHKAYTQIAQATGYDPITNIPIMADNMLVDLTSRGFVDRGLGLYRVTEVYWMSQRKVGKVVYEDHETGQVVMDIVDDNFVVPEGFEEKMGDYFAGKAVNTVYWTYAPQPWKGIKINYTFSENKTIYVDLDPVDFQFKSDYNIYGAKLPVCGRVFNNRNAQSMSLVDLMKPHQIGYNVCMNQIYQLLEKEIGKFMIWDSGFFNTMKDWGGEDSWDKVALVAKELGHVFGDTSPANMKGANPGNQLPKMVDMELTSQMMSRAKLAEFFENRAMAQLGVSPQMMSDVKATETASGINTAVTQAQLNIQKYYTDFFEYKQRCLTMSLDISQYVQATNRDITITYTKSDASREFVRLTGIDLLLKNMHVYVVNSQALLRQMEMMRQWIMQNTSDVSGLDVLEVIQSYSPAEIKLKLQQTEAKRDAQQQQAADLQNKQIELGSQAAKEKEQNANLRNQNDNETKKEVAYINTYSRQPDNAKDSDNSGVPDSLEYNKFNQQVKSSQDANAVAQESNNIKRQQNAANNNLKKKDIDIKERQLKLKEKQLKTERYVAKVNKN